eukprot:gene32063-16596_t
MLADRFIGPITASSVIPKTPNPSAPSGGPRSASQPGSQKLLVSRSARERSLRCNVHVPDKVCDESLNTADAGSSLAPDADGDESPNTAHASPNQVPDMVGGTSTDTAHASPNQVPDMVGGTSTDTAHAGPSHVTDAVGNESIDAAHAAPSHVPDAVGNESNDQAHAAPSLVPDIEGDDNKYFAFISAYLQALDQGHMMFLAESYGSDPFRFFMELDFNWEDEAEDLSIIDIARRVLATSYKMDSPVAHIISIRTPFKVHLNFPDVMTTYTKSLKVREDIINICKAELGPSMAEGYEWDKVVDFPHGSFRILGSRKTNKMDSDPEWVKDKSYLPVRLENGRWVEEKVTLALLRRTSIFPTAQELAEFEQSAAFADMAFLDMEVRKAFLDARREKKRSEGRKRSEERKGSEERKTSLSDDAEGGGATTQPEEQQTTSSEGGNGSLDLQSSEDGTAKVILNVQDP